MESTENIRADVETLRRAVQLILNPNWKRGDIVELRALGTKKRVCSGYFDAEHSEHLVSYAAHLSGVAQGVYITLNPVTPDCLARAANRAVSFAKHTTGDGEITHRHWLLIDTDPSRPSGISANDEEHDAALNRAITIRSWLAEQGWPEPIYADSGNGGHLLYRVDLPPNDEGLLQRVLKALGAKHTDMSVEVDLSVHNPARISKLYGTLACKGDSIPERPHRIARLLEIPDRIEPVARELLEAVASMCQAATPSSKTVQTDNGKTTPDKQDFDVVEYLRSHGVEVGRSKPYGDGGTLWELTRCPWQSEKSRGGPYVIQFADGGMDAGCHHPECQEKGWNDLRDLIDPGWQERTEETEKKGSKKGTSVAQQCVASAAADELFHTPEQEAYATISRDSRRETWRVKGKQYRLILRGRLHEKGIVANDSALDDAIATLEGKALFDGPEFSVHIRTARADGKLYIDLCNEAWKVVEISEKRWRITSQSPVKFIRKDGMLPLPSPIEGGSVEQLRPFVNMTDEDWPLAVAWLIGALRPTGPYPILVVNGEHGSCKSTTCRRLRSLVDPNSVAIRAVPKNDQTLMIWATNSHVVALDNLSSMPTWLSDAMCRLATGGGYSERALYTDDGEKLFFATRPQMVNGIEDIAIRSDFLDRALSVHAPVLPSHERKEEEELDKAFAAVYPGIFGALLTAASQALKELPKVKRAKLELPRMADFFKWGLAVEAGLGWPSETFMRAMTCNQDDSNEAVVAGSLVGETIRKFVKGGQSWEGTWSGLLDQLNEFAGDDVKRREGWPHDSRTLSNRLRLLAPNLRGIGIDVEFHDKKRPKRLVLRSRLPTAPPAPQESGGGPAAMNDLSRAKAQVSCFANDWPLEPAEALCQKLWRFWTLPPLAAPVAAPPLPSDFCDGAEMPCA